MRSDINNKFVRLYFSLHCLGAYLYFSGLLLFDTNSYYNKLLCHTFTKLGILNQQSQAWPLSFFFQLTHSGYISKTKINERATEKGWGGSTKHCLIYFEDFLFTLSMLFYYCSRLRKKKKTCHLTELWQVIKHCSNFLTSFSKGLIWTFSFC